MRIALISDLHGNLVSLRAVLDHIAHSHVDRIVCLGDTTPPDALDEALGERRTSVMAGGHTHIQMMRQHRGTLLVNPGSLGLPFETYVSGRAPRILGHAEYATIECVGGSVAVTLHRVPV